MGSHVQIPAYVMIHVTKTVLASIGAIAIPLGLHVAPSSRASQDAIQIFAIPTLQEEDATIHAARVAIQIPAIPLVLDLGLVIQIVPKFLETSLVAPATHSVLDSTDAIGTALTTIAPSAVRVVTAAMEVRLEIPFIVTLMG